MSDKRSSGRAPRGCCSIAAGISLFAVLSVAFFWIRGSTNPSLVVPAKIPLAINGFDKLRNAATLVTGTDPYSSTNPDPAAETKYVNANQRALAAARNALTYPYLDMSQRSPYALFPHFAQYRNVARLFASDGRVKTRANNYAGAADASLDAIQLGETVPKGCTLIGKLVGIACEAIGRRPLYQVIPHLTAADCRRICKRYETLCQKHVPESETFTEEKYCGQESLLLIFRGGLTASSLLGSTNGQSTSGLDALAQLYFLVHSKRSMMESYTSYMDQLAALSDKPWPMAKTAPSIPTDPILSILEPSYSEANFKDIEASVTQNALCLTAIALQGYKMEHGSYPAALDKLIPTYLSRVPNDPFTANSQITYRRSGSTFILYSIGPDGVDDGGKPIDDPSKATKTNPRARYFANKDSKGDILFGTNIY